MGFFERFRPRTMPAGTSVLTPLGAELKAWRIVKVTNDEHGKQAVIRIRISKPERADIESLTTAVVVKWSYDGDPLPSAHVNQQQLEAEEALDPLSSDGETELVQVSTGMNLKEWVYYTRSSSDSFTARLNQLLSGHPRYPLEIAFFTDPAWRVWHETLDGLKEKGL